MKPWVRRLGRIAWALTLCGTIALLALMAISPGAPDAAHPVRYVLRHDVRYVSEDMSWILQILLGVNMTLGVVAASCHFATKDPSDGSWPGRIGEP